MINSAVTSYKFSLTEYQHLVDIGFWEEEKRIELINGEIIEMAAKGTAHTACSMQLIRELSKLLPSSLYLRCQDPIVLLDNSQPEPDFAIVYENKDYYLNSHPTPDNIAWLIEISDSSLVYDQGIKLRLYAEAKIQEYWIFNLVDFQLEVYSQPYQSNTYFDYRQRLIYLSDQLIALPNLPEKLLDLTLIFPC